MEETNQQNTPSGQQIMTRFAETLAEHVKLDEQIDKLPINMTTISSSVLLAEREGKIESALCNPSERYTKETLLAELEEIGVRTNEDAQREIDAMIGNGYINIGPDGTFAAEKRLVGTAQLLDRTFPGMPSLNLVAYLIQTIDEVLSGRKELEFAISQFNQTLKIQKQGPAKQTTKNARPQGKVQAPNLQKKEQSAQALKSALSRSLRKRQTGKDTSFNQQASVQPVILTSTGKAKHVEIKELFPNKSRLKESATPQKVETDMDELESPEQAPGLGTEDLLSDFATEEEVGGNAAILEQLSAEVSGDYVEPNGSIKESPEMSFGIDEMDKESVAEQEEPPSLSEQPDQQAQWADRSSQQVSDSISTEEDLEKRIESFQQHLAMTCPMCSSGQIQEQQTEKGKSFFSCTNKDCVFVSWGKPYHLQCPLCKNPFLVEATGRDGETILKCPRAPCRYQQNLPGQVGDFSPEQQVPMP